MSPHELIRVLVIDDSAYSRLAIMRMLRVSPLVGGDVEIRGPGGALPEDREVVVDAPSGLIRLAGIASAGELPTGEWDEGLLGDFDDLGDVQVIEGVAPRHRCG